MFVLCFTGTALANIIQPYPAPVTIPASNPLAVAPAVPTPGATAIPLTSTSTGKYVYSVGNNGYTQISCNINGLTAGAATITSYVAYDAANALTQTVNGYEWNTGEYDSILNDDGNYTFVINGAAFFDLYVTSIGTGSASIVCNPRYSGPNADNIDGSGNHGIIINGQSGLVNVPTPAPAPTGAHSVVAVEGISSGTNVNVAGSRNSTTVGIQGIIADNPANAACNGSIAQIMCGLTLTGTSITNIVTGVTSKQIYLMFLSATNTSGTAVTMQLSYGTSGSCGTGNTPIGAPILVPPGGGFVWPMGQVPYAVTPVTNGLCAQLSGSATSVYINSDVAIF
jgi:hypothetical protein